MGGWSGFTFANPIEIFNINIPGISGPKYIDCNHNKNRTINDCGQENKEIINN